MGTVEHEEFNFVVGWENGGGRNLVNGMTVMNPEKTIRLQVDYDRPVTLERCREILDKARELSGRDLVGIDLHHSIYDKTPGNECGDFAETCHLDKKYRYLSRDNSLTIFDRGEPVYTNENGVITRGDDAAVAYYDSLDV